MSAGRTWRRSWKTRARCFAGAGPTSSTARSGLIEKDDESYLAWARERFACVIFNLHLVHTPPALEAGADAFRDLIDLAIRHGGSYYLTYHRWARRDQVEACYPQMGKFLALKRHYDPDVVFQSNWSRHYEQMWGLT